MNKKQFLILSLIFLIVGAVPVNGFAKTIDLALAHFGPATHASHTKGYVPWAKTVEDATDGRVKITIYPAQTLVKANETYDAVVSGVADIGAANVTYTAGRFPITEVITNPFLGISSAEVGSRVAWRLYQEFPEIQKEYGKTKILFLFSSPPLQLSVTKRPVRTLDDMKGLVVRTTPASAPMFKVLGSTPTPMAFSETYSALEKGVIEAISFDWGVIPSLFKDIGFYHTEINHISAPYFVCMNLDKWNSLPSDIQKAIDSVSGEKGALQLASSYDGTDAPGKKWCQEHGKEFIVLSAEERKRWVEASRPIWNAWLQEVEKKGLPGDKILNRTLELVKEYSK